MSIDFAGVTEPRTREQELTLFAECVKQWADYKQRNVSAFNGCLAVECHGYNDIADLYFYVGCVISDGDTSFKTPDVCVVHGSIMYWNDVKQ